MPFHPVTAALMYRGIYNVPPLLAEQHPVDIPEDELEGEGRRGAMGGHRMPGGGTHAPRTHARHRPRRPPPSPLPQPLPGLVGTEPSSGGGGRHLFAPPIHTHLVGSRLWGCGAAPGTAVFPPPPQKVGWWDGGCPWAR